MKLKEKLYRKKTYHECTSCNGLFYYPKNTIENNQIKFSCPKCDLELFTNKIQERKYLKLFNADWTWAIIVPLLYINVALVSTEYLNTASSIRAAILRHTIGMGIICIFLGLYFIAQQLYWHYTSFKKNVIKQ